MRTKGWRLKLAVTRCSWHPRYFGHPRWFGVALWRGVGLTFTDGLCARCAPKVRAAWGMTPAIARATARGWDEA